MTTSITKTQLDCGCAVWAWHPTTAANTKADGWIVKASPVDNPLATELVATPEECPTLKDVTEAVAGYERRHYPCRLGRSRTPLTPLIEREGARMLRRGASYYHFER